MSEKDKWNNRYLDRPKLPPWHKEATLTAPGPRETASPEKLDKIIKMAKMCASPLPWENDITKANEKIFELWTAGHRFWQAWRDKKDHLDMQCAALDFETALNAAQKMEAP